MSEDIFGTCLSLNNFPAVRRLGVFLLSSPDWDTARRGIFDLCQKN